MTKTFRTGDKVEWTSHGSTTHGVVEQEITERTEAAGRTVDASEDEPQYLVRSDTSGGTAVHKPSALRHRKG
jgi:plastocyanin